MEHSLQSYLNRRSTAELQYILQCYMVEPLDEEVSIVEMIMQILEQRQLSGQEME